MTSETIVLFVGLILVLFLFFLKVGLFNSKNQIDMIKSHVSAAEFPIDATSAVIPLYIALSHSKYGLTPWLMVGIPTLLVFVVIQIAAFKSIQARSLNPESSNDTIAIPAWIAAAYLLLFISIFVTYNIAQGAWQ
ncbi:hypothetical protein [Parasphingorhabdus sp.]|uniref:hypothetical protein n=1 Tax=Parasphingorhabdus sp. TaxID=2709688 RepID=UPI003A9168D8